MAEQNPPAYLQAGSHPANLDRQLIEALVPTEGVIDKAAGDLAVSEQSPQAMGVTVAAGKATIAGDEASDQGAYFVVNDAPVNLAVAAADPTNDRIDLVIARVRDAFYSGADNEWELDVLTGTAAGTPVEPTVPDNAIVLARIDVTANLTPVTDSDITDRRAQALMAASFVGAKAKRSGNQTINSGVGSGAFVQWDTAVFDTDGIHDPASNNTRFTAQRDGYYRITCHVLISAAVDAAYFVSMAGYKNGVLDFTGFQLTHQPHTSLNNDESLLASETFLLAAGDYIEFEVTQTSGEGLNVKDASKCEMVLLR